MYYKMIRSYKRQNSHPIFFSSESTKLKKKTLSCAVRLPVQAVSLCLTVQTLTDL